MCALSGAAAVAAMGRLPWLVGAWVALAYLVGARLEAGPWIKLERERQRVELEAFCAWAEAALAAAPEELPEEQERLRSCLQRDYQTAQAALEKLRR